jgi:hypothetical protein
MPIIKDLADLLATSPTETLQWLEDPRGRAFNELAHEWADKAYRHLRGSKDDIEVFRAQGALEVLDKIFAMPEEIKLYLNDISTGKRKKIERKVWNGMA